MVMHVEIIRDITQMETIAVGRAIRVEPEVEKVMEALEQAGIFPDSLTLQREAFHALLIVRPELLIEGAVILYKQGDVSFARTADLCGLSPEERKQILAPRGIVREVAPLDLADFDQAPETLRIAGT
jgi:predicted HTH domain antitoxin